MKMPDAGWRVRTLIAGSGARLQFSVMSPRKMPTHSGLLFHFRSVASARSAFPEVYHFSPPCNYTRQCEEGTQDRATSTRVVSQEQPRYVVIACPSLRC